MNVFIVGQVSLDNNKHWEFCGVFSTLELARAACKGDDYFIGPATLDEQTPDESMMWPGALYANTMWAVA